VRKCHLVSSAQILANNISLNDRIYKTVKIDKQVYAAAEAMPDHHRRVLDCDPLIIDIQENVHACHLGGAYAQSFLKEELGKMYRGELILLGTPEIEPNDVIMLLDDTRGISGPIEVESVLHTFDLETGFITVVTPRALILINESASAGLVAAMSSLLHHLGDEAASLGDIWSKKSQPEKNAGRRNRRGP
jgi:hypothetical protein